MRQPTIKLFCIPFSGGNAYSFAEFKKYLPTTIELCNLELPGRGRRIAEPLLTSIDDMTEDLFRQIEHKLYGNYAIFGHSLGALLAFTLCRHIAKRAVKQPVMLFVSGQTAPSLIEADDRHNLPNDQFIDLLREMEGTPEELLNDQGFMSFYLPVIKADFKSIGIYQYHPFLEKLNIPIAVFMGEEEDFSDQDALSWQLETDHEISLNRFEGGHFFIIGQCRKLCQLMAQKLHAAISQ